MPVRRFENSTVHLRKKKKEQVSVKRQTSLSKLIFDTLFFGDEFRPETKMQTMTKIKKNRYDQVFQGTRNETIFRDAFRQPEIVCLPSVFLFRRKAVFTSDLCNIFCETFRRWKGWN